MHECEKFSSYFNRHFHIICDVLKSFVYILYIKPMVFLGIREEENGTEKERLRDTETERL